MTDKVVRHHRFYFPPDAVKADLIDFPRSERAHMLSSLRLKQGDLVTATDGNGRIYEVVIEEAARGNVRGKVLRVSTVERSGPLVTVFQGVVKASKMEVISEKCVELGVAALVPVATERSISRVGERRLERMQRIAVEAMKQSLGAYLPRIDPVKPFDDVLSAVSDFDLAVAAWEGEGKLRLTDVVGPKRPESVALWVGPEGGFTPRELEGLTRRGAKAFGLGSLRLKSETAAIAAVAILNELFHDS